MICSSFHACRVSQVFVQPASRDSEGSHEGLPARAVARNLVNLVNESQAGELASLEEVVASLVKDNLDTAKDSVLDPEVHCRVMNIYI